MSTRSSITVKCSDNIIRSVYCHFDGYLSGVGAGLLEKHNSQAQAEFLVSDGDLRTIMTEVMSYKKYFDEDSSTQILNDISELQRRDYDYYWDGSKWLELNNPEWNSVTTPDNLSDALALIVQLKAELARLKGQ